MSVDLGEVWTDRRALHGHWNRHLGGRATVYRL